MPGSMELLVIGLFIVYILLVPLLYTVTAHFFLFRKKDEPSKFWKNFRIYLGIFILALTFKVVLMGVFVYFDATRTIVLYGIISPYLDLIFMFILTLFIGYLASKWIKYNDGTAIGFFSSLKIVGTVFVLSVLLAGLTGMFSSDKDMMKASMERQESINKDK